MQTDEELRAIAAALTHEADDGPSNRGRVGAEQILDVLRSEERRLLLAALPTLGEANVGGLAERLAAHRDVDTDRARASLHHVHLPKLADAGFVRWDRETGQVAVTDQAEQFLGRAGFVGADDD